MNDNCGRFHFSEDMNGDGLTTISDVLLFLKTAYLLPSNAATATMQGKQESSGISQFFEMDCNTGQGGSGAIFSLIIWLVVLVAISASIDDARGK